MRPKFRVGQAVVIRDYQAKRAEVKAISQSKITGVFHYIVAVEMGGIVAHLSRGERYLMGAE